MVGHAATELLVGAHTKTEPTPGANPEMRDDANIAIEAVSEWPAGAGCQEKQNLPAKGKVFLLDIPFYRTRLHLLDDLLTRGHVPLLLDLMILPGRYTSEHCATPTS